MSTVIYLIGEPGAGKTTLLRAALPEVLSWEPQSAPFAHRIGQLEGRSCAYLGNPLGAFAGTDRLSMSVLPVALKWLDTQPADIIVGEGDRLASGKFFAATPSIVVAVRSRYAAERRARRAAQTGAVQNPSWVAGRQTKTARLMPLASFVIDNDHDLDQAAGLLRSVILAA